MAQRQAPGIDPAMRAIRLHAPGDPARLVDGGELRPLVGEVFPLADARAAFERSLGGHRPGKLVLRVADDPT